jgi:hypothetical protein
VSHEGLAAVLVGDLVDLAEPVVEHRLGGIAPGVVKVPQHEFLREFRRRLA